MGDGSRCVNISTYLDSYGLQLILWGFVEQDEWGHQVLLLAINLVGFQSIQEFVVTQEYVPFLDYKQTRSYNKEDTEGVIAHTQQLVMHMWPQVKLYL